MVQRRTVDLLPEIFRTDTNKKFLSATLDQLVQEPSIKRSQGYIGRKVGPGVNPADNYISEPSASRADYQLEPGVVFFKPGTETYVDAITYPGMIDALDLSGAQTQRQDRLFQSQYYCWDPFCDLDKFTNYSQYYWLPAGPDSVDISSANVPSSDSWSVVRGQTAYSFSDIQGNNPVLTLARGGTYTFDVNQLGKNFWIQSAPGIDGRLPATPNISSRDVLGVVNNGDDVGTITFNVPLKNAQDFYFELADSGNVDLVSTDIKFNEINNIYVDAFFNSNPNGIDGITNLNGRTVIFTNNEIDPDLGGWQITSQFDPLARVTSNNGLSGSYDTTLFDQTTNIDNQSVRYSVWLINYVNDDDGNPFMQLTSVRDIPDSSKLQVKFGSQWSSTQWYKTTQGFFEQVPLLTAILDTLFYQDSENPLLFGSIKLVDTSGENPLNLDDIIGAKNYTSPNGVVFTNGLKVQFRGPTLPAQFQNLEYYVEGVGTGPGIDTRVGFVNGEAYFGPFHVHQGQKMTGASHTDTQHQFIYDTLAESLLNLGSAGPSIGSLPTIGVDYGALGNGIKLLPVSSFVTPETYTKSASIPYDSLPYDATAYDEALNEPLVPDYITINRAAADGNPWSRSNRWFHIDVIRQTAEYNNQTAVLNNNFRAKRPIIEFRADIKLYNYGTQSKGAIDIIDFETTDAFSTINGSLGYNSAGQPGYYIDGYGLIPGSKVIFAADTDPQVRNKIFEVTFIDPDGNPNSPLIIHLVPVVDGDALINQSIVCLNGVEQQGLVYWFDGSEWIPGQQKTAVNQPPLFDVFDSQGTSLSDQSVYPSSNFSGSKLFGYAIGTGPADQYIGTPLRYLNINNVGDIVFQNFFYTDEFVFTRDRISSTEKISQGLVRQYLDRVSFQDLIGWQTAVAENRSRQVFRFAYDNNDLILDIEVDDTNAFPALQIFIGTQFLDPTGYTFVVGNGATVITLLDAPAEGTIIEVQALSNQTSQVAFYQVPLNLENNALNEDSPVFTLGTIRTHYQSIGQNLKTIQGPIDGANNTRDLGDILRYGNLIVQQSSPLTFAGVFLRRQQWELFNSLAFNSVEYEKAKAILLDLAAKGDFVNNTPTQILDDILLEFATAKTAISPFYWSDMLPANETYIENSYTFSTISTNVFDTVQTYDFTASNYKGLSIYLNGALLTINYDYEVDTTPTVTINVPLSIGDIITIREYETTYGNFIPNTPTKLGLYPAYKPEIYLDTSYVNPTLVVRGHDGSVTIAYGDARDEVLLEFETRIFNNLKIKSEIPLQAWEVIPGQFRNTNYTLAEINSIFSQDFLSWVGWNKLDYTTQTYLANNEKTYNYSQSGNKINGEPLLGAWRGIYEFFYDTDAPNTRPWEMLGFSQEPSWWLDYYGPAPYTSGNLVLWEDLAAGIVRDPAGAYVLPQYIRPRLLDVIPVNSEGALLMPLNTVVGQYDTTSFRRSWTFGDDGPTENAWRSSSAYPFAVMRLLALTKPAKFFALFIDRDRYKFESKLDQFLWDSRYRLDAKFINPIYGQGVSKASYVNWIVDFNQQLGSSSSSNLQTDLSNIGLRLCWRVAGFTDKRFLKIYSDRSTPDSDNTSLLLPDESYQILLYPNQAFQTRTYSSVIVQTVDNGYAVFGYSSTRPYFEILVSRPNGLSDTINAGNASVQIPVQYSDNIARIPYGYVFTTRSAVCDFLASYGAFLTRQGWEFEGRENGYIMDWRQMAEEFLNWSTQGWITNSLINLNPGATKISVSTPGAVAESIVPSRIENIVLNQNRLPLKLAQLNINRLDNTFSIDTLGNDTINYLNLRFSAWEHLVVFDNRSIFADLIYDPTTGARQQRLLVNGIVSADWNGTLNAPGFVLNQNNIPEWQPNQIYTKGEIVLFKNEYWTASTIIQPSREFDYGLWLKSDYDQIQKGLLLNAANASDQLSQAYNIYAANLEEEVDLFSYGLIGFRPREYMQSLNLNDVSQVQLYQQFLGTKGTLPSLEIFTFADLGKESAEYRINELWAMLRGQYGATANRSYFELLLNQALLPSDPSLIQIVQPQTTSQADQTVLVQDIWKSSFKISDPDILPTLTAPITDSALPSAGYVNLDDADITLFSLDDATQLSANLSTIGVGTTIWVAKSNAYDWNIYVAEKIPGTIVEITDNLDALSLVTFDAQHGLVEGDYVIIKNFNIAVNGAYRVISVPGIYTVLIDYIFTGSQDTFSGEGVGFTLQTTRVAQPSDINNLAFAKIISPGAKVWVDNDGTGRWTVLEKTDPYDVSNVLSPAVTTERNEFGYSVAQGFQNLTALIGAPGYNPEGVASAPGAVYPYFRNDNNEYEEYPPVVLNATAIERFGTSLDIGDQNWGIIGAPSSNSNDGYALVVYRADTGKTIDQTQLLTAPDQDFASTEFGYAVTISQDERWIYVSAPVANKVYAYGRQDVQLQTVSYVTDGQVSSFNYSNHIVLTTPFTSHPEQLVVTLGNQQLRYPTDWTINDSDVQLTAIPNSNLTLRISRRSIYTLDSQVFTGVTAAATSGAGIDARFTISNIRGVFGVEVTNPGTGYQVGDTVTFKGTDIGSGTRAATSMANGVSYTIVSLGTTNFTLYGAASNTVGLVFTASGVPAIGDGTVSENLVLTVTQTGLEYISTITAGLSTVTVSDASDLSPGQTVVKLSGAGDFGAGALISSVAGNTATLSVVNATSGFISWYAEPGGISLFTQTGSGISTTTVFDLAPYLATATNIHSFRVTVDSVTYRPNIDYTFAGTVLTFLTVPAAGAIINVFSDTYFRAVQTIEIPDVTATYVSHSGTTLVVNDTSGIVAGMVLTNAAFTSNQYVTEVLNATTLILNQAPNTGPAGSITFGLVNFGHSIATTTDGNQILIGCTGSINSPGQVYVFNRSTQTFPVTADTSLATYTVAQSIVDPAMVYINGQAGINTDLNIGGNFTKLSSTQVQIDYQLTAGDIVTIDTNNFVLLQVVESPTPYESAEYGAAVDICTNDCSVYVGAPKDGSLRPEAGKIEYWTNQSRVYGTIVSNVANPTLTAGDQFRINNIMIQLYSTDISGNAQPGTVASLVQDINNAQNLNLLNSSDAAIRARYRGLSNVSASSSPDVILIGDGVTRVFDVGTVYSDAVSFTSVVYIDDVLQVNNSDYTYNNANQQITFTSAPADQSVITVVSGRLVLTVLNAAATTLYNQLTVLPGTGSIFDDLGWNTFVWQQSIESPLPQDYAHFGQSLFISTDASTLLGGAPNGSMVIPQLFDNGNTSFDARSTIFSTTVQNTGVIYQFDALNSANETVSNPTQFVFGQQIINVDAVTSDQFGQAIDLTTGTLLVGQPGFDFGDSAANYGVVSQLINETQSPAWVTARVQSPAVSIQNLNTVYIYDLVDNNKQYFDFFDPLQGKLLGVVRQNLDYIGAIDPAEYNVGAVNNRGRRWGQQHVGEMWWDINSVRFVDPNQNDITYASRTWGQIFPGSVVTVYQWVASPTPPSTYDGLGIPRSFSNYSVSTGINEQGIFVETYYFWVSGIRAVNRAAGKTLSTATVSRYIESPRTSGITYIAPISPSTIAIYNGQSYISAQDTVLHVEFDQKYNTDAVHVEYQLIPAGQPDGFLTDTLYRKLQDSFVGSDTAGNPVPDPLLPPSEQYGVLFRPRQGFFSNRFLALENYLTSTNDVLRQFTISENRASTLLNSAEPEPSSNSGAWNTRVADVVELSYQNLDAVPLGYKYLVRSDATNNGLWSIYEVISNALPGGRELLLIRVQNYDTRLYWQYIDWYLPSYNVSTRVTTEVPRYSSLATLSLAEGSVVKVTANAQNKWELYQLTAGEWIRVGLQDGTIEFKAELWDYQIGRFGFDTEVFDAQYFDQEPTTETRQIIRAINEELLIGDLLIERNRLLILMFNYILSEQIAPTWLTKTSLIDVDHVIRNLLPFQTYRQDNQDFVLNYIQEVKPYHTQIREFSLIYNGSDEFDGSLTDFDLPAYWNPTENLFISPVLDDTGLQSTTSSTPSNDPIWQTFPYNQWYNNYLLSVEQVDIVDAGSGYTSTPTVEISPQVAQPAEFEVAIRPNGSIFSITVINPGYGYSGTPTLTLSGGGGSGAILAPIMGNQLVRNVKTVIKYDRYQYQSDVVIWEPNVNYDNGTLVRYDNRVWEADASDSTGVESVSFDPDNWTLISAADLSGVDRTYGFYVPTEDQPGLDLALLMTGIDYPGVQVKAPDFNQNTGFDVGNFDINPFDNISFGPEGRPTYDPAILDAIYESYFGTPATGPIPTGTSVTDINVDGSGFVDTYSSHAPEELVPGAIFDTMDFKVFTTPGADWAGDGHGFAVKSVNYQYTGSGTYSFADLVDFAVQVEAWNQSTGIQLVPGRDFMVNWIDQTLTMTSGINIDQILSISAFNLGGGNQIYRNEYVGSDIGNQVVIPVNYYLPGQTPAIQEIVVFVNGQQYTDFSYDSYQTYSTQIIFDTTWTGTDKVTIVVLGVSQIANNSWSTPVTQLFTYDGGTKAFVLTNSLQGTNPANLIVEVNGRRARPAEGVKYVADGSSLQYYLPTRGGYNQSLIADNEVQVYINNQPQILGIDFVVDPYVAGIDRSVTLAVLPEAGDRIEISVSTLANYYLNGNILIWRSSASIQPLTNDIVSVTTWNDTAEQDLLTQVFVGPETTGIVISQGYDTTQFDQGTINAEPGSFDFSIGAQQRLNIFDTGRDIINPNRLLVTLNGFYLFNNVNYVIDGSNVVILGSPINDTDVVAITTFTANVIPGAIAFRIFQDMTGQQQTYRITPSTTTALAQPLSSGDDIIYVADASALSQPNLTAGIFGVIMINGERITYRARNLDSNTISGLRRGTWGTGASSHSSGSAVTDMGLGNLLPEEYQDVLDFTNILADGSTTTFVSDISISGVPVAEQDETVLVYVGGIRQYGGYTLTNDDPVTVQFVVPPTSGYQVSIRVLRSLSWYQPGTGTASDGIPLQEQNTVAARFIRGE